MHTFIILCHLILIQLYYKIVIVYQYIKDNFVVDKFFISYRYICYFPPDSITPMNSQPQIWGNFHQLFGYFPCWFPWDPWIFPEKWIFPKAWTHSCVCVTHSYVWPDTFAHVTWPIHTCVTYASFINVWHDSFICVPWLVHQKYTGLIVRGAYGKEPHTKHYNLVRHYIVIYYIVTGH